LATIGGIRIADRALAALRASTTTQVVVANDPAAREWFPGEQVVADEEPGLGPLAGIAAALEAADGQPVIVLAWDMPFVPAALLERLREWAAEHGPVDAVVPVHGATREPLCAWYAPSAIRVCRDLLAQGERRARALAATLPRVEWLDEAALSDLGDIERLFTSVDTPERLAAVGGALP
jgi:molybdopterin-guanine dinucleotide biosynthesis protein A